MPGVRTSQLTVDDRQGIERKTGLPSSTPLHSSIWPNYQRHASLPFSDSSVSFQRTSRQGEYGKYSASYSTEVLPAPTVVGLLAWYSINTYSFVTYAVHTVYEVGGTLEERMRGGHPPTNLGDGCLDLDRSGTSRTVQRVAERTCVEQSTEGPRLGRDKDRPPECGMSWKSGRAVQGASTGPPLQRTSPSVHGPQGGRCPSSNEGRVSDHFPFSLVPGGNLGGHSPRGWCLFPVDSSRLWQGLSGCRGRQTRCAHSTLSARQSL